MALYKFCIIIIIIIRLYALHPTLAWPVT